MRTGRLLGAGIAAIVVLFGAAQLASAATHAGQRAMGMVVELIDQTWSFQPSALGTYSGLGLVGTHGELCSAPGHAVSTVDFGTAPISQEPRSSSNTYTLRVLRIWYPNTTDPQYGHGIDVRYSDLTGAANWENFGQSNTSEYGGNGRGGTECALRLFALAPRFIGPLTTRMDINMFQACNGLSCGLTVVDTVPIIFTGFGQGPPAEKPSDTGSSPVEQHCVVPKVVGKTLAQARKAILAGHCVVGQVRLRKSATIPKGQIVAQAPRYNTVTTPGAAVTLVVSG